MLKTSIPAGGSDEGSHGLRGLEEEDEARGGDLSYGEERGVVPC